MPKTPKRKGNYSNKGALEVQRKWKEDLPWRVAFTEKNRKAGLISAAKRAALKSENEKLKTELQKLQGAQDSVVDN